MLLAIAIAVSSVAAGTLLAFLPWKRDSYLGPVRTFALTAALGVVLVHLLPEALAHLGGWALLAVGAGLFAPHLLEGFGLILWRAAASEALPEEERRAQASPNIGLEAGYFGLLFHRLGDGIGLGAYTGELHAEHGHHDVLTALAAHAVPVVTIVVLAFDAARGRGSAIVRAGGLALASVIGVLIAGVVPLHLFETSGAWVTAAVAGLLIHVVTHDLSSYPPRTARDRTWDIVAAACGFMVSLAGAGAHEHGDSVSFRSRVWTAFVEISVETAPMLLLGLLVGAVIQAFGSKIPSHWLRTGGVTRDAVRGALVGAPLPLCSCSVLPVSEALHRRGAAPALLVAFLIATPELGVETFALSVRFLGWPLALLRLAGALLVAFVAAVVVAQLLRGPKDEEPSSVGSVALPDSLVAETDVSTAGSMLKRVGVAFDELLHHVAAWMVLGVVAAAFLEATLPDGAFTSLPRPWVELLAISAVAIPSYVCAPSATPLAAVMIAKGLSPGAALVALLLGPATNLATLAMLRRWYGGMVTALACGAVVIASWSVALMVNHWLPASAVSTAVLEMGHEHGPVTMGITWLFAALLLRSVWRSGTRGWFAAMQSEHGHSHDHGHGGHAHGHGGHGPAHGQGHAVVESSGAAERGHAHGHAHGFESHGPNGSIADDHDHDGHRH